MIPKTTALAVGWHLSRIPNFPFFRDTHLMHFDTDKEEYVPMRVRESQPTTPPTTTTLPHRPSAMAGNGRKKEMSDRGDDHS